MVITGQEIDYSLEDFLSMFNAVNRHRFCLELSDKEVHIEMQASLDEKVDQLCICGHTDSQHDEEKGCRVFLSSNIGECPCEKFRLAA